MNVHKKEELKHERQERKEVKQIAHHEVVEAISAHEAAIEARGVSAGYFNIHIEETAKLSQREKALYRQGFHKGEAKLEKLVQTDEHLELYAKNREVYLKELGIWASEEKIIVDTSELSNHDLEKFEEGYKKEEIKPVQRIRK